MQRTQCRNLISLYHSPKEVGLGWRNQEPDFSRGSDPSSQRSMLGFVWQCRIELQDSHCMCSGASPKLMFRSRLVSIHHAYLAWRVGPCGYHHISIWDILSLYYWTNLWLESLISVTRDPRCGQAKQLAQSQEKGIKAQPLSSMRLASSQGDPFSSDWVSELLSKCFLHELSKTLQMGFFTLWLMIAWHMAWKIKSSLPAVHIYKILFISTRPENKQDIFHPWKAVSVCMCKLVTTTKSMTDDPNEHHLSEIQIVITFCFRKRKYLFHFTLQTSGFILAKFLCSWKKTQQPTIHKSPFCFLFMD